MQKLIFKITRVQEYGYTSSWVEVNFNGRTIKQVFVDYKDAKQACMMIADMLNCEYVIE